MACSESVLFTPLSSLVFLIDCSRRQILLRYVKHVLSKNAHITKAVCNFLSTEKQNVTESFPLIAYCAVFARQSFTRYDFFTVGQTVYKLTRYFSGKHSEVLDIVGINNTTSLLMLR